MDEHIQKELRLGQMDSARRYTDERIAKPSIYSCPDCGGVLWEIENGEILRFRCHIGHVFSLKSMLAGQTEAVESALWIALKNLQEHADLLRRLVQRAHMDGQLASAQRYETKLSETNKRIEIITGIFKNSNQHEPSDVEMGV